MHDPLKKLIFASSCTVKRDEIFPHIRCGVCVVLVIVVRRIDRRVRKAFVVLIPVFSSPSPPPGSVRPHYGFQGIKRERKSTFLVVFS